MGVLTVLWLGGGPAAAAVDDAALRYDPVNYEGIDRSNEPLADWDDIDLGDNAATLLRAPDRTMLRLAPGRDVRERKPYELQLFRYDDPDLNRKRLLLHAPEHNTLRNFLMLMFLTQE